jgi:hypothetical protein
MPNVNCVDISSTMMLAIENGDGGEQRQMASMNDNSRRYK